jgi:hypothetical protein
MLSRERLAALAGLSYHTLRTWSAPKRKQVAPEEESLRHLSHGMREHARKLLSLADEVDAAVTPPDD